MKQLGQFCVLSALALLSACGGSESAFVASANGPGATVAAISLSTDRATIPSDGSVPANITAFVRGAGNVLLKDVPVSFTSSSGAVQVATPASAADGTVLGVLRTAGDASLRTITVTASAGGQSASTTVQVVAGGGTSVGTLTLVTSTPTIPSDASLSATITAFVRDASNNFISGVPVSFSSTSGGLQVTQATTTTNGVATATLSSAGDPTNRVITVTAQAQTVQSTVTLNVTGSKLTLTGPVALVLAQKGTYTIALTDSGDKGIANKVITLTSARGNMLSAASVTTDTTGRATVDLTVANAGNDSLTASGLALVATQAIAVNADTFVFTTPAVDGLEVPLGTPQTMTVHWLTNGTPVSGQVVSFTTTRGTLSAGTATTNGSGDATVTVSALNAGGSLVTATAGTASAQRNIEFIATSASAIDIQSSAFTIAPNEQATLTATVRDAANNLVKNKTVNFTLTDITGGSLTLASAVTNSQGRAQTIYTAASGTSARDGVNIAATVAGTAITKSVKLTVAQKQVFISLGTGNTITLLPNNAQYDIPYAIQVTDANGNGVPGVALTVSVLSEFYRKGNRAFVGGAWTGFASPFYTCVDEDNNRNGVLDAGEDFNNSGFIEAGNIALVTPNNVTTNAQGIANVDVIYPADHAYWLDVTLEARTAVQGTEFKRSTFFTLPGRASDFNDASKGPPGPRSPFGVNTCNAPN